MLAIVYLYLKEYIMVLWIKTTNYILTQFFLGHVVFLNLKALMKNSFLTLIVLLL